MSNKFSEGIEKTYAELPVPVNYLYWKRGNAQLSHLEQSDPGAYFGGWAASVIDREDNPFPALPLPIVTRKSDDGKATFERYATNVLYFLPIASRQRYELRQKAINQATGKEEERVVAVAKAYESGVTIRYQPNKQVFGLVYSPDGKQSAPAVLKLNKWSSYISFGNAAKEWAKVKTEDDEILIRRYGSLGAFDKKGNKFPNFEIFNEGKSTPIEAIGTTAPFIVKVTPELDNLWEAAQAWAKCEKWNAPSKATNELTPMIEPEEIPADDMPF